MEGFQQFTEFKDRYLVT